MMKIGRKTEKKGRSPREKKNTNKQTYLKRKERENPSWRRYSGP